MNIGEFIIRTAILLIIFVVPGVCLCFVYKKTEKAMDFMQSETLHGIVTQKRMELSKTNNDKIYEFVYFIQVEDDIGEVFDITVSSNEYFEMVNGSKVKLEFYKNKLIKIKYEKRGKRL